MRIGRRSCLISVFGQRQRYYDDPTSCSSHAYSCILSLARGRNTEGVSSDVAMTTSLQLSQSRLVIGVQPRGGVGPSDLGPCSVVVPVYSVHCHSFSKRGFIVPRSNREE